MKDEESYASKIIVDQCLPLDVAKELRKRGFSNAVHILETDLRHSGDSEIFRLAKENDCFIITSDRKLYKMITRYVKNHSVLIEDTTPHGQRYSNKTIAIRSEKELLRMKFLRETKPKTECSAGYASK
jgi:predicted nuclease of predicted toxin-antitoxin system